MASTTSAPWQEFLQQFVVLDTDAHYVYVGRFEGMSGNYLILEDADAHDLRDTTTNREKYVLDCREHGVRPNRRHVLVNQDQLVAISRLEDVLTF